MPFVFLMLSDTNLASELIYEVIKFISSSLQGLFKLLLDSIVIIMDLCKMGGCARRMLWFYKYKLKIN